MNKEDLLHENEDLRKGNDILISRIRSSEEVITEKNQTIDKLWFDLFEEKNINSL